MKRNLIYLIFAIGLNGKLFAQNDSLKSVAFGGHIILPIEFPIIKNGDLNAKLTELGYPKCNYPIVNFGIGLQLYIKRWVTTFSYNKSTRKDNFDNYMTMVEYTSTSFNVGYDLTKDSKYSFYPFLGFKGYGLNYLYRDKLTGELSFSDYFNTTAEYKEMTYSRSNFDFGFGVSFQRFFLINLRAGYLLPFDSSAWKINNAKAKLNNSPSITYNYYFTLTLGLGGIVDDNKARRIQRMPE